MWLHRVNDVKQELLVDNLLLSQVRQISFDNWIFQSFLDQSLGCKHWHSGHSYYLHLSVEESLQTQKYVVAVIVCSKRTWLTV